MGLAGFCRRTEGAVAAITALFLVVAVGMLALSMDLGRIYLVKSELQRAADAGAMAGALGLLSIPPGTRSPVPITPDCARGLATSQAIVAANQADGGSLQLLSSDVYMGRWDSTANTFVATGCASPTQVNAVKVVVRKDSTANGAVPLTFAGLLPGGMQSKELTAQAVGLTGYAGYAPPGAGTFPIAVDADKVPPDHAMETVRIHLSPTPGDDGCWHTFDDQSPGASDLRNLINGTTPSPPLQVGDQIKVKEGVSDSVLQETRQVFDMKNGDWTVLLPVIPADTHIGWTEVLGFVAFKITDVVTQGSDKYIEGYTVPNYVAPGVAPGGPNYGLWAGVPKMVQ